MTTFQPRVTLLTTDDVSEYIGVSKSTLAKWRMTGLDGPAFIKLGAKVAYDKIVVENWLESRRRRSTSDTGKAA